MAKPDRSTFQARLKEKVNSLSQDILNDVYKPGDFLPSEMALTERFHLSKSSVRLGLDQLLKEGLIVKVPRVGTQVVERPRKTKIRLGVYPSLYTEADMGELIESFQRDHPAIQVETLELPYTNAEALSNLLRLGIVDVLTLNLSDFLQFRESGSLSLLEAQNERDDTYPFLNDAFSNGHNEVYCRPFLFSPVILCYNKDHFRDNRIFEPDSGWSWAYFRDQARKLKTESRYGFFFWLASLNRWSIFFLQNKGIFETMPDGRKWLKTPDALEALRMLRELIRENGFFPLTMALGYDQPEILFKQQRVSAILTTYYRLNELKDADFRFEISQVPRGLNHSTLLLCTGIAINKQSKQREAARVLADYLTSERVQTIIRRQTYSLPANKWVVENEEVQLPRIPLRLELHREMIPNFATYEETGLTMKELFVLEECLKQYFTHFVNEDGLMKLFNEQLANLP